MKITTSRSRCLPGATSRPRRTGDTRAASRARASSACSRCAPTRAWRATPSSARRSAVRPWTRRRCSSFLKPLVLGQDPLDRERLWQAMWQRSRHDDAPRDRRHGRGAVGSRAARSPACRSIACWAPTATACRPSVSSAVLASQGGLRRGGGALQGERVERLQDPSADRSGRRTSRCARPCGSAVGDDYTVMLDSTWAYQYPEALRVGQVAEELGFYWYEDPLADDDLYNYVKLKQQLSIPILATEYAPGGFTALRAVDHLPGHRLPARRRGGEGRDHAAGEDRAPGRGLPHELRDPPRRQLAEQRGQPPRDHGHPQLRVLRGAAPGRRPEVRAGPGHRGGRARVSCTRPRARASAPPSTSISSIARPPRS